MSNVMDIEAIELKKYIPVLHGEEIEITTPVMNAPFGLEEYYGKLQLKLSFYNYKSDTTLKHFFQQIYDLEKRLQTLSSTTNYHSNIKKSKGYDPLLVLRVNNDDVSHLSTLKRGDNVRCKFLLKKLWNYNEKSGTMFELSGIEIISK